MARNPLSRDDDADDERISRTTNTSAAGQEKKAPNPQEGTYLDAGREDDGSRAGINAMSEDEVEEFLRNEFINQVLPTVPAIPGYHICWLSTTNQYDTIAYRMRLGYVPVTQDDIPHFQSTTIKTGEYSGMLGVNEMLLFKIPETLYQRIMKVFHHDRPAQEEERLRANLEDLQHHKGQPMIAEMGDGTEELLRHRTGRAPAHWD